MKLPQLTDEVIGDLWHQADHHLHKFAKMLRDWLDKNAVAQLEEELSVMDRGCFERGCCCHDDRVDTDGVVVRVHEVKDAG